MSRIAQVSLLGAFAFSTLGFLAIGKFLGPELPAGATPFYVLAGICGVAGVFVWSPWNAKQRAKDRRKIAESEPEESASPYQFDLTKLTGAGWLLFLVSGSVALSIAIGFSVMNQGAAANPRTRKVVAAIGLALAGAVFYAGRWWLQRMGIPLMKRPLKRSGAKAKSSKTRPTSQTALPRHKKRLPTD